MKLSALNQAIRGLPHAPKIERTFVVTETGERIELTLDLQKGPLLDALKAAYPEGGRNVETGLSLTADGVLVGDWDGLGSASCSATVVYNLGDDLGLGDPLAALGL